MLVREAVDADWARIHPFFSVIVAAGETYAYPDGLSPEQARLLWTGQGRVVVAVEDDGDGGDTVLGSATMGPNRPGRGAHVATASFMVDPQHGGRGVGRALGEHVIAWAGASGFRGIQFTAVVETNTAAVALWRSLGFGVIGTVPGAFRSATHGYVGLHVMYRSLVDG